ncbi:glutathione S-transferase family protein [Zobellella maritima]|uniref:glutathione S-transferase family protein n=1 Tax=Zobellella maritima TaxID=2059725 RepID=UPI000E2FF8B8|nr:glutathione S-transferase family protein [Zobellella maritima]
MQLYSSTTSPFVRKVLVVAHEAGCFDSLEQLAGQASPIQADMVIAAHNPLGLVPTAIADDGQALYDSRVICEYLDAQQGAGLFPADAGRWPALTLQSLADGILDAALLARYEQVTRPAELRWEQWQQGQMGKISRALAQLEQQVPAFVEQLHIGTISLACALGYLDLRFSGLAWRDDYPQLAGWYQAFSTRQSMVQTAPQG